MACAAAAVHKKKPQSRLLALLALSWACLQTAQPVLALAGPTVRAALFDPRTPAFWLSRCSSRPSPSTSSGISTGPHRQLRPLRVSPRRAVQAEEPSEQGEGGDDEDQEQAASAQTTDLVEDAPKDEQLQKSEEDLAAARRARDRAESAVDRADQAVTGLGDVVAALQRQWLQEYNANNSEKADEIETKIDEIEAKREKAKKELEEAKKELKEAEQKYAAKASVQVDVSQAAEFFGKLLFDDTEGWPLTDAGYSANPSCIIELSLGPFNGQLALSTPGKDKAKLLDRDTEMQDMVTKIVDRAQRLKGWASSDKSFSPALLVAQAPGSGKSHFLAELGEKIQSLPDLEGQEQKPIVSAFTYNSAMSSKLTHGSFTNNNDVDLALRVLYGAAHHMTRAGLHCTSWMGFLDAINAAGSSNSILASLVNLNFVVKILRYWYGARPLVILADEVGKSDDEGRVRNRLCQLMDSWAGQVYVVMSALSDYEGTLGMFNKSNREVEFQILPVLGVDTFDKFQSVLTDLDRDSRSNTQKAILRYRIGLAWGATAGYARAVEKLTDHLRSPDGLSSGSVIGSIAKLGELGMDMSLPPRFKAEELEALLQSWESVDCPFQQLSQVIGIMSLRPGMYRGSVLVEPRSFETPQQQTKYLPTVAAWHAASWFETSLHLVQSFPRSQKLWHMMGKAYRAKRAAIESRNKTSMKQAAAYFTEVTGAVGVMLAIVKLHDKLPQALKTDCQSFLDIGFNDSLAKDPDLATANEHEAQQKLDSFLQKAQDLGINHCGTSPFLVIMAPANCMALDFVIFCPESGSLVAAVQVKSNTLLKDKDFTEQAKNLGKAAKTVRQLNMDFLAVLGSNFPTGVIDDLHSLQQDDLVALIPPFLRHLSGLAAGVPGPDSAE